MPRLKAALVLLSLATACVPATLRAQTTHGAVPGTINFVQGQANIDGQPITLNTTATRQLRAGQTLAIATGSADLLLAPGALLRTGADTTVRMVAADNSRTEVRLEQGIANVSVNVVRNDHLLLVDLPNGQAQMLSRGLYAFNTATGTLRVFAGEADVFPGTDTTTAVKPLNVREGHELTLKANGSDRPKPVSFDRELADTDLLPWVGPRESQAALADATVRSSGSNYDYAGYGSGFYGDGPTYAGFGYGYPYGFGYPYGPYGLYGYPFFGVGFGFFGGGYYGGYGPYRGPIGPIRGPVPVRGGNFGGVRGGFVAGGGRSFGGGFHGGGGHR